MSEFTPRFDGFAQKIRDSFAQQKAMQTIGITMADVSPGHVELSMPFNPDFTQQHGFIHAGLSPQRWTAPAAMLRHPSWKKTRLS